MLELKNVSKFYYKKGMINTGFSKVNLKFNIGEFIAITGESGSGKSTLLNVISGLDSYEEGEMYINGEETSYYTEKDYENYRKKYIGNIFQNFNLVNSYTVYQNIELIYLLNGFKSKDVKNKIIDLLNKVDLIKYKNKKVSKLSGGQKQRVAIARALAQNTPIILADEPTGNLDKRSSENVLKLLHEISKDKLVIIVTHNYNQIEEYVTRKITMNDGKVIEDKKIKDYEKIKDITLSENSKMKPISKIKLGTRNAFNILSKFLLITIVYLFVVLSMFTVYGNFNDTENIGSTLGDNWYFDTSNENRVIITKKDETPISSEDLKAISNIKNISSIYQKDILLDNTISLNDNENYYFYGKVRSVDSISEVSYGRLPENDNEVVIYTNPEYNYYLSEDNIEDAFSKKYTLDLMYDEKQIYKIVGVIYTNDGYDDYLYFTDNTLDKLYEIFIKNFNNIKYIFLGNQYENYIGGIYNELIPSNKVPKGKAYISEDYSYSCKNFNCKNYTINITSTSPHTINKKKLKVSKMYNKDNFKKLLNLKYKDYNGAIFINENDYNNLFDKSNYQSSVFIENSKYLNETLNELDKLGYKTLYLRDTLTQGDNNTIIRILNIVKVVVNVSLIVVLFFISYFIIKLILKSRNIYYSTLRILGSTFKDTKKLLNIELFTLANIAYFIFLGCIYINQKEILKIGIISSSIKYMNIYHYILIYILIALMTILTTQRYSRKLFVNSVMNTYREEV